MPGRIFFFFLVVACEIWFPDQGSNPGPLHWERGVLATGPPGKSPKDFYLVKIEFLGFYD